MVQAGYSWNPVKFTTDQIIVSHFLLWVKWRGVGALIIRRRLPTKEAIIQGSDRLKRDKEVTHPVTSNFTYAPNIKQMQKLGVKDLEGWSFLFMCELQWKSFILKAPGPQAVRNRSSSPRSIDGNNFNRFLKRYLSAYVIFRANCPDDHWVDEEEEQKR